MSGEYGDRVGPQGNIHYPEYGRGCYYSGVRAPCLCCVSPVFRRLVETHFRAVSAFRFVVGRFGRQRGGDAR